MRSTDIICKRDFSNIFCTKFNLIFSVEYEENNFCLNFFQKTLLLVIYINLHNRPWQPFRWVDVFNEHDFGRGLTKGLSGFIPSSGSEEQWFWIFTQSEAWAAILDVSPDAISFQILGPCGPLKWAKLGVQSKIQGPTKFSDKSIRYIHVHFYKSYKYIK
jgi:hypothetical protein